MSCNIFAQLYDFLCQPEVTALYSSIRKLQRPKLQEALRIRGLISTDDDESLLRVRLLRYEMQFYHPEIPVPDGRLTEGDAAALRVRVDALGDLAKTLSLEAADATSKDSQVEQSVPSVIGVKPLTDATFSTDTTTENQVKYRLNCVKLLKVCNLQYSGTRGLPAQDFLESLEDFRRFSKIDERVLLEILPCVLDLSTRKWYRASNFTDWRSFEQSFVEDRVTEAPARRAPLLETPKNVGPRTPPETPKSVEKRPVGPRTPVSRTLRELRDSLLDIGLKAADSPVSSRRTSVASDTSSVASAATASPSAKPSEAHHLNNLLSTASHLVERKETEMKSGPAQASAHATMTFNPVVGSHMQILKRGEQTKTQATVSQATGTNNNNNNATAQSTPGVVSTAAYYATRNANVNGEYSPLASNYYPYGAYRCANDYYLPNFSQC